MIDSFELKKGMLLWLKESNPYRTKMLTKDKVGNVIHEEEIEVSFPRKEVRVEGVVCDETTKWKPLVMYYEINSNPRINGEAYIGKFEWHPNNRRCFSCKNPMSQTSDNICTICNGIHCDVDGYCLCDWKRMMKV